MKWLFLGHHRTRAHGDGSIIELVPSWKLIFFKMFFLIVNISRNSTFAMVPSSPAPMKFWTEWVSTVGSSTPGTTSPETASATARTRPMTYLWPAAITPTGRLSRTGRSLACWSRNLSRPVRDPKGSHWWWNIQISARVHTIEKIFSL